MMRENNGTYSVGLLAMSPGQCPGANSVRALQDPVRNMDCGISKFASLVDSTGWISGPDHRGAAENWSTLRGRYTVFVRAAGRNVTVGKKSEVIAIASRFKSLG
jgi:hypothetical protein